jgi:hypothetical protein
VNAPSFSEKHDRTSRCTNGGSDVQVSLNEDSEDSRGNRTGVRV